MSKQNNFASVHSYTVKDLIKKQPNSIWNPMQHTSVRRESIFFKVDKAKHNNEILDANFSSNAITGKVCLFLVFPHLNVFIKEDAKSKGIILIFIMSVFFTGK